VTSRVDHKLGLTPMLKRLAFYYLQRGVGEYTGEPLPAIYTKIVVRSLYDWKTPSDPELPSQGGVVVEFFRGERRVRWVEFGCRVIGGGGDPIVREV
jgi:hypothetical protein